MRPGVNLLPLSYRRVQARRRRIRIGTLVGAVALGAELMAGLTLHTRAGRTREMMDAAEAARAASQVIQQKMKVPAEESALLNQQLTLARKLRTTHRWSRLLGTLATAASARVTLTGVSTDPPRWSVGLSADEAASTPTKNRTQAPGLLQGLSVRGCATDYEDLTKFISSLQAAGAFASLNLREAKRDKYLEQDVISFELQCRW